MELDGEEEKEVLLRGIKIVAYPVSVISVIFAPTGGQSGEMQVVWAAEPETLKEVLG